MVYQVFAGNSGKKKGCDTISQSEIQDVLKKINVNDAKVLHVKQSPLVGICEVAVEREGKRQYFI